MVLERYEIRQNEDGAYIVNTRDLNSTDPHAWGRDYYLARRVDWAIDALGELLASWILPREIVRITAGDGCLVALVRRPLDIARDYAIAENALRAEMGLA